MAKAGLTVVHAGDTPYFAEARLAIACRKLYRQPYLKECFVDLESEKKWYPEADYHTMYIGKVTKILALQGE